MGSPDTLPASTVSVVGNPPNLLAQLREAARTLGYAEPWVGASSDWCRRFILFHGARHPRDMGVTEIETS
jgi:hypothetical protein